jgi:peptide/nickel transport system substrate-binding protein
MRKTRKVGRISALLVAGALAAAACGGSDDSGETTEETTEETAREGCGGSGTLVWAHEQEPGDMHLDDPENNLTITAWIRAALWEGLYGVSSATEFIPELLAGEAEVVSNDDGSVTANYTLRDGLVWSDGDDLTADDVKYTYDMVMAKGADGEYVYLTSSRDGLETITDFTVNSATEFSITWSAFFAGWKGLFTEVHPSHVFPADPAEAAAAENEALRTWTLDGTPLPSSGPMVFSEWNKGVSMSLVCSSVYHGSTSPDVTNTGTAYVDGVTINFVADTDAQINAMKSGEADIIMPQPQLAFEELANSDDFGVSDKAGPVYEHWGLNLFNKHLKNPLVREAVALAMDKGEVMAGLYTPLFGEALPAEGLGNVYWLSNQSPYVDHAGNAGYGKGDVDGAKAKLEEAGYTLGDDGIYTHPENGKLTLRVGTTGGNALRELQQQLLQAKYKEAGIEIVIENPQGAAYFSEQPFNPDALACASSGGTEGNCDIWDIAQFAWVGGPWPGGMSPAFKTGGGNNLYGYSNATFDAKADECDTTVDDTARAECYNELNRYVTTLELDPENGLFMLPLTQKPSFFSYSTTRLSSVAVAPDANNAGPIVYVVDYKKN